MNWTSTRHIVSALFFFLLATSFSYAQGGTTSLRGTILDPKGSVVPDAEITLSNPEISANFTTHSDKNGFYQFLELRPSTYTLTVNAPGFAPHRQTGLTLQVSTPASSDIQLQIATGATTVEVVAGAQTVNTQDATLGNTFDSQRILALPFEGRDAAGVLSLQPGVTFVGTNVDDNVDTRNGALNGGRSDQANITLDGVDNNQQSTGKAFQGAVRSTLDSIEEFRVTTIGDNADQGRSSGGQVSLVTKSGSNSFHGSLYEQNRPTVTAANDYFNKTAQLQAGLPNVPGKVIRNTFGGSLGGPVIKNRFFFFGTYEGQRLAENEQVTRNIPSPNLQDGVVLYPCAPILDSNGNVVQTATSVCPGGSVQGLTKSWNLTPGTYGVGPTQIASMDLNCSAPRPGFPTGTCPNGNGINSLLANAQGTGLFQQYPTANSSGCGNNDGFNISCYTFSAPNPTRLNTSIARLDYNITKSGTQRLFLRGNYQTDSISNPPQFPGQAPITTVRDTSRAIAVGYTAALSNTMVNNFRFGLTRQSQATVGQENGPNITFRYFDDLHPSINSVSPSTSYTNNFQIPVYNWTDDLSWSKGRHTLQFGVNIRRITNTRATDIANINYASSNPNWLNEGIAGSGGTLDPGAFGFPGVDLDNANPYNYAIVNLVGLIPEVTGQYNRTAQNEQIAQGQLVPKNFRSWESDFYAQDSWRATPSLTLTFGLRYSLLQPVYETHGNQVSPDSSLNQYVTDRANAQAQGLTTDQIINYSPSGQANGKAPYWPWDYKNLGPRFSFAYSPNQSDGLFKALFGGAGKSSIRGGFGIVYDHFGTALIDTFDQNGAFGLNTIVTNPAAVQSVDGSARFSGAGNIPTSSPDGVLLNPPPTGPFPYTPPVSTLGNPLQQITFGFDDKLKTPYSETIDLSFTRELPGGFVVEAAYVGRFAHRLLQQRDLAMPLNLKDPKSGVDYFTAATQFAKLAQANTPVSQVGQIAYWENFFPSAAGVDGSTCGGAGVPNPTATQSMYELFLCNWGPSTFGATNFTNIFDSYCFPACANINGVDTPYALYNKEFSALYAWSSLGNSNYNAGQFSIRSRMSHGLQFDFNYVLSK
jgi:hypothetical protein